MSARKVAIIASTGGLDTAYKALNIATAAASMGAEVAIFYTFEGLNLIHRQAYQNLPLPAAMAPARAAFKEQNVPEVPDLTAMAQELGVKIIACQMTMDLLGIEQGALVENIEVAGAATFLAFAFDADVTLTF